LSKIRAKKSTKNTAHVKIPDQVTAGGLTALIILTNLHMRFFILKENIMSTKPRMFFYDSNGERLGSDDLQPIPLR